MISVIEKKWKEERKEKQVAFIYRENVGAIVIITCGLIRLKIVELNFLRCSGRRASF